MTRGNHEHAEVQSSSDQELIQMMFECDCKPELLKVSHGVLSITINQPECGAELDDARDAPQVNLEFPLDIRIPSRLSI